MAAIVTSVHTGQRGLRGACSLYNNPYLQETVCGLVARHPVLRATILISRIDEPMRAHSPLPEAHVNDSGSSG